MAGRGISHKYDMLQTQNGSKFQVGKQNIHLHSKMQHLYSYNERKEPYISNKSARIEDIKEAKGQNIHQSQFAQHNPPPIFLSAHDLPTSPWLSNRSRFNISHTNTCSPGCPLSHAVGTSSYSRMIPQDQFLISQQPQLSAHPHYQSTPSQIATSQQQQIQQLQQLQQPQQLQQQLPQQLQQQLPQQLPQQLQQSNEQKERFQLPTQTKPSTCRCPSLQVHERSYGRVGGPHYHGCAHSSTGEIDSYKVLLHPDHPSHDMPGNHLYYSATNNRIPQSSYSQRIRADQVIGPQYSLPSSSVSSLSTTSFPSQMSSSSTLSSSTSQSASASSMQPTFMSSSSLSASSSTSFQTSPSTATTSTTYYSRSARDY